MEKCKKQTIPLQKIWHADYAEDLALHVNAPTQEESLLHNLEQAADSIDFYVNANILKYICFKKMSHTSL